MMVNGMNAWFCEHEIEARQMINGPRFRMLFPWSCIFSWYQQSERWIVAQVPLSG